MKIKRRTLALIIRRAIQIFGVGLVLGLYYFYFHTTFFTVTTYQITGVDEESRAVIDEKLHQVDKQKAFKVFPLDKILTYSSDVIDSAVIETVPEAASITTRPVGFHTIKVQVTLLKPLFRISDSQALSAEGIIFSTKYKINTYPRLVIASSTTKTFERGGISFTQLVASDTDGNLSFLKDLSSLTSKISSVVFPVNSIRIETAGDVVCENASGTSKVTFLKDTNHKKVWSTLVSAIDTEPLKTKLEKNKEGLEYLDVRYGNKVFYRFNDMTFQNGSVNGILGNHATTTQEATTSLPR